MLQNCEAMRENGFFTLKLSTGDVWIHESTMFLRFIAFMLSLCIALPMCWCSLSVACPGEVPPESCCAAEMMHEGSCESPNVPADDCRCCASQQGARDQAKRTSFELQKPVLALALPPHGHPHDFQAWLRQAEASQRHADERGPPAGSPRLYLRQCALLI